MTLLDGQPLTQVEIDAQPRVGQEIPKTWRITYVDSRAECVALLNQIEKQGDMVHDLWPRGSQGYEVVWWTWG